MLHIIITQDLRKKTARLSLGRRNLFTQGYTVTALFKTLLVLLELHGTSCSSHNWTYDLTWYRKSMALAYKNERFSDHWRLTNILLFTLIKILYSWEWFHFSYTLLSLLVMGCGHTGACGARRGGKKYQGVSTLWQWKPGGGGGSVGTLIADTTRDKKM